MNIRVHVFMEHVFSILLGTGLGVEFLGPMLILCLTLWETAKLFFQSSCIIFYSLEASWVGFPAASTV